MELLPVQQQAYQKEQQAQIRAQQTDTKEQASQHQDELTSKQAALDAQLTELQRHKVTLGTEWAAAIDFTKAQARARAISIASNYEGMPHPTFAKATQNVAVAVALLDTLPVPSTDGVDKVYHHLRDILCVAVEQQAESSL
jgi:hypothetical protein